MKRMDEYSFEEKVVMLLHGSSFAVFCANKDRERYEKFKAGEEQELLPGDIKSIEILTILEGLGYPLDELGTYLYKEVIAEVCDSLKGVTGKRDDMDRCRDLLDCLNNGYSAYYVRIAQDYLEMGVESFHLYIQKAIEKINNEAIDWNLSCKIFGPDPMDQNYGLQAFQLATYMLGLGVKKQASSEKHPPRVRKLSTIPDDIYLKLSV